MEGTRKEHWWRDAVIYQIYPRSFQDSNGDGIGDLRGIIQRLDYLKELGIDAIWLSPVCKSPQDDNGYDISDYQDIDPMFGSLDDMEELIKEAKKRNIRIIMDLVLNHSSDEHRWFQEAKKSKDNPYHDYYVWRDGKEGVYPNDMRSVFGGSAWEWVPELEQYYFHQFSVKQPDLNWENPKVRREIYDMILWWMELYSNPDGSEFSMVFQFEHIGLDQQEGKSKWDVAPLPVVKLKQVLAKWQRELHGCGWNSLFWNNHDLPRIVSRWGNDQKYRVESAKMLATLLHGMQGTPYIYQGEELGMTNVRFADISHYQDIETLNMYKERLDEGYSKEEIMHSIYAKGRDNARTPMQWSGEVNAGFTKGTPWLEVNPNYTKINAESELSDPDSVFYYYQKLIRLRKEHSVFVNGEFTLLMEEDPQVFAYIRKEGDTEVLVCANFSETPAACDLLSEWKDGEVLIWNYKEKGETGVLRPYEAMMIRR